MSSPVDGFFLLAGALALACAGMLVLYLLQRRWNEADVVDFGWSAGIGLATVGYAVLANGYPSARPCGHRRSPRYPAVSIFAALPGFARSAPLDLRPGR